MKKKSLLFLLVAFVCVLVVGCGKDKEDSSKKESANVSVLTCSATEGDTKISTVIKQDKKTFKLTEITTSMEESAEGFDEAQITEADLEKMICNDDSKSFKSCSVKIEDNKVIANMSMDAEKYEKELLEDEDEGIDKLDGDTLNKLKTSAEDDGFTCTLK